MTYDSREQICRLCTREVSDAIHLFSEDSVERGVADRIANLLELPLDEEDGLSSYVCQLCNARFNHLVRSLEVQRLHAKKSHEKLAKKAGIFISELPDDPVDDSLAVEDAKNPKKDPLVKAADMTSMNLGSLLSDLVAAKQRMREKAPPTEKKIVTEDIKDLMNLLSGIRKEDVFVFGTFLGIPESRLRDIECNYSGNFPRLLVEVVTAWINTCPESATWTNLAEALTEVGHRKTAQEVAEKRGIILPGVYDEGQLWKALKALIPINEGGSDLVTLLDETEQLRKDVKTKDALLLQNEERLEEVNVRKMELEQQYNDTLQELEEQKEMLKEQKGKAQKDLREKEAELRKLRANRADKEVIESMEIEIMYLKKKVQQHQAQEQDLMKRIVELQEKLESNDISKLEWIAGNLEKQLEGVRPEFEDNRSKMMNNIYKLLTYVKIPEEIMDGEERQQDGSPEPDLMATTELEEGGEENEEEQLVKSAEDEMEEEVIEPETTPKPEPTDLVSLLSSLKSPTEEAVSMFEDKPFVEEDQNLAVSLFEEVPPFLLSQILSLPMDRWLAIEAGDSKDEEKQRSNVLGEWRRTGSAATWSVLVETLVELGLRGRAQTACIERGVPLLEVNEDGPVWHSMKETLSSGNEEVQGLFAEAERIRSEVKSKDEMMCIRETQLEQARMESELIKTNLKRAKQDLAKEVALCKSLEMQISQKSLSSQVDVQNENDRGEFEPELEGLKEQHRQRMDAIQNLWKEKEERKEEYNAHSLKFDPQQQQMNQMKEGFAEEREMLVAKLEVMYDLCTGREKPVPKVAPKPMRPPQPKPRPPPRHVPRPPPPTTPIIPGGYRTTSELLPNMDPVVPTGYNIMDLLHPSNTFSLLPANDIVGRPLAVSGNFLTGIALKGRGSLSQECVLTADIAAPWVVALKVPNRGRLMVDDRKVISIKNTPYQIGDPAFEFIVRPHDNKRVTFESRKFGMSFLSVGQNAALSVQEMPPDSSEVQFAVRVQRFNGPYTTHIACPFGRPSLVNQLKDRSVIQLYSKVAGVYLGLKVGGGVVGITNSENDLTYLVYCDRGLGRVSLNSYTSGILRIKMRFNGSLLCQGEENLDNDFYLKENPDGTVVFESVPNKGRFITVPFGNKQLIRNFSINVLVFSKAQGGRNVTITKYMLN